MFSHGSLPRPHEMNAAFQRYVRNRIRFISIEPFNSRPNLWVLLIREINSSVIPTSSKTEAITQVQRAVILTKDIGKDYPDTKLLADPLFLEDSDSD